MYSFLSKFIIEESLVTDNCYHKILVNGLYEMFYKTFIQKKIRNAMLELFFSL